MEHPITPPDELVQKLRKEAPWGIRDAGVTRELCLIVDAYRAGADQELGACCEVLRNEYNWKQYADLLFAARRPKPPSLKEQAQAELDRLIALIPAEEAMAMAEPIRRALEQLNG